MRSIRVAACIVMVAISALRGSAQEATRAEWGAPRVAVSHAEGAWTIRGQKLVVTLDESNLALRIVAGPAVWQMVASEADDMLVKATAKSARPSPTARR